MARTQITLRIPEEFKKKLEVLSERKGISVNELIVIAIDKYLDKFLCTDEG